MASCCYRADYHICRSLEQFGVKYDFNRSPSYLLADDYHKLKKMSPTYHATLAFEKTTKPCVTPTHIVLDNDDLRIHRSQGIN